MNILAFDTSSSVCSIAISVSEQTYSRDFFPEQNSSERRHTDSFLIHLDELLHAASCCTLSDFNYIAVGVGAGSFTGIRLSCSIAQMLSFSLRIPVFAFSSMLATAQTVWMKHGQAHCHVLLDARMNRLYSGEYQFDSSENIMVSVSSERMVSVDSFSSGWVHPSEKLCRAGNGWSLFSHAFLNEQDGAFPSAESLIQLALHAIRSGKTDAQIGLPVQPNYLFPEETLFKKNIDFLR